MVKKLMIPRIFFILGIISICALVFIYIVCRENNTILEEESEYYNYSEDFSEDMSNLQYLGFKDNDIFYIRDNSIYLYNVKNQESNELYTFSEDISFMNGYSTDEGIIILECMFINDELKFTISLLDFSSLEYSLVSIYEGKSIKIPYIYITKNNMFLNYYNQENNTYKSFLEKIELDTHKKYLIDYKEAYVSEENIYTGDVIVYCGGDDKTLYYQMLSPENEHLEQSGIANIMKYSLKKNEVMDVFSMENIGLHVSGTNDYILFSEYNYDYPIEESGLIIKANNSKDYETFLKLPYVNSGNDINNSKFFSYNKVIFYTPHYYYYYDLDNYEHYLKEFNETNTSTSNIQFSEYGISYLEFLDNEFVLNIFSIRD